MFSRFRSKPKDAMAGAESKFSEPGVSEEHGGSPTYASSIPDPERALKLKETGNKCFAQADWNGAQIWYRRA